MSRALTLVLVLGSMLVAGLADAQQHQSYPGYNYTGRSGLKPLLQPFSNSSSSSSGGFYYFNGTTPPANITRGNVLPGYGAGTTSVLGRQTTAPTTAPSITYKDLFGAGGKLEYNPAPPTGANYYPQTQDVITSYPAYADRRYQNNQYEWAPPVQQAWQMQPYGPQAADATTAAAPTANVYPTLYINNRVYVAVRDYFAPLGVTAYWDSNTHSAVATLADARKVVLPLDSATITVDGKSVQLPAPVVEANEVLMVPLQDLSDALGVRVTVDAQTSRVFLTMPLAPAPPTTTTPAATNPAQ